MNQPWKVTGLCQLVTQGCCCLTAFPTCTLVYKHSAFAHKQLVDQQARKHPTTLKQHRAPAVVQTWIDPRARFIDTISRKPAKCTVETCWRASSRPWCCCCAHSPVRRKSCLAIRQAAACLAFQTLIRSAWGRAAKQTRAAVPKRTRASRRAAARCVRANRNAACSMHSACSMHVSCGSWCRCSSVSACGTAGGKVQQRWQRRTLAGAGAAACAHAAQPVPGAAAYTRRTAAGAGAAACAHVAQRCHVQQRACKKQGREGGLHARHFAS